MQLPNFLAVSHPFNPEKALFTFCCSYFKLLNCLLSGFNPAETRIRTPDGKIWHEEKFHISRELYRDIALQLTGETQTELIKPHSLFLRGREVYLEQVCKVLETKNQRNECYVCCILYTGGVAH